MIDRFDLEVGKPILFKGELIILKDITHTPRKTDGNYLTQLDAIRYEAHHTIPDIEVRAGSYRSIGQALKIKYPESHYIKLDYKTRRAMKYV